MPKRTFTKFNSDLSLFPCLEQGEFPSNRPTIKIDFYVRERRNDPYVIMCAVPTSFHKSRKATLKATNFTKKAKISIKSVSLQKSGPVNCFVCKTISGTSYESTFQINADQLEQEFEFFLKVDKLKDCKQRIIIEYICDTETVVLEDWNIETLKSHKFESSKKGKALVFTDVSPLVLYPDAIAQSNESFEPETKKKRLNPLPTQLPFKQTCDPVISSPLFKNLHMLSQRQEEIALANNLFPLEANDVDFLASLFNSEIDTTFSSLLGIYQF